MPVGKCVDQIKSIMGLQLINDQFFIKLSFIKNEVSDNFKCKREILNKTSMLLFSLVSAFGAFASLQYGLLS